MTGQHIGYIRVSSAGQNTERQLVGIQLDKVFEDKVSGKSLERPKLQEMLEFVRDGDTVVVHSMDRLARNLDDLRALVKTLTRKGVTVEFVKEGLSFSGDDKPMPKLLLSVMGAFAEFERSIIRERQLEGIALAKEKGVYKGRKKTLGAADIATILHRITAGDPKSQIARDYGISRETLYKNTRGDEAVEIQNYKFYPYLSTEIAFLSFMTDFHDFAAQYPNKVYLRNGPKDPTSGLRPREILGLVIMANVAMYLSKDTWVPGWIVGADGKELPEDIAHDGAIRCTAGIKKGQFMRFEQTMATEVAANASPEDIESAIIQEITRKSARSDEYAEGMALIVFTDYTGQLSDLRKLADDVSHSKYKAIYLISVASKDLSEYICVILKNPSDTRGPISVKFKRPDGVADVQRQLLTQFKVSYPVTKSQIYL